MYRSTESRDARRYLESARVKIAALATELADAHYPVELSNVVLHQRDLKALNFDVGSATTLCHFDLYS